MGLNDAVWFPSEEFVRKTRLFQWMNKLGIEDYDTLYQQSIDDIAWFWKEAVLELDIIWKTPFQKTLDLSKGIKYPQWFTDGRMNIVDNAVVKWANHEQTKDLKALIWEGDDGSQTTYSFTQLSEEVSKAAAGLTKYGVKRGDVVTLYLPMIPETVISMLAIAKIGAIFSPAFSGYGAEAVATRINSAESKFLITADGYFRRGKTVSMKPVSDQAVMLSPSIETVFVVRRAHNDITWNEKIDVDWKDVINIESTYKTVDTAGSDPLMILYTSGTTGKPKGIVHTHAGFPIKAAFDAGLCMDVQQGDTFFWYTDMGWMMGPFLVFGSLVNGAAILLFEGTPDYPSPSRIWEITSRHQVSHLGISPTLIRSLMKHDVKWIQNHDTPLLRMIGSTGEPWNPEPWLWLFEQFGNKQIPIVNYSGGTEISGGILGNVLLKPISPITFNSPILGMDVHVYDEQGHAILNKVGELVIAKPWVGMTIGFWNEDDRYEQTYWTQFTDIWVHGDWVIQDEEGYWTITGRSDDILNVAGKRLGPAELESILVKHEFILEAAAIGIPDEVKGETPICFIVLIPNVIFTEEIQNELDQLVETHLGKSLKPKDIFPILELPKTKNGKVMRRVIKSAFLQLDAGDISSLENPTALEAIRQFFSSI